MYKFTVNGIQEIIKRLPESAQKDPNTVLLIDEFSPPTETGWLIRISDGAFLHYFGVFSSFIKDACDAMDTVVDYLEDALDDPQHSLHYLANASITQDIFDWEPELLEEHPDLSPADIVLGILEGRITSDHTMGVGNRGYWYCPHNWKIEKI